ncbi:DEAD/DEAH box helicase [Deinococcus radiophilus]|uniref:DEAD/DEAH box helicase n=1 Tax=Deinococcus radiophilus TaxID=32062 RepID=UPI00361C0F30
MEWPPRRPATPDLDQPPLPDSSETEPVHLPLDAQGQNWLNKLRSALPSTEVSDRPLRLQLAPVQASEDGPALSVTLYADTSGSRDHLNLFHLSDYLQSYTGVVRSRRSLPGPLRPYQPLLETLAAHAILTSVGGQEAWRLPADARSENWLLDALTERLLFWGDHPAPLTLGPDLQEPLEWLLDARGYQRLRRAAAPELAALTTLTLAGEWYFPPTVLAASAGSNAQNGQVLKVGRVISALDGETEAHLLALPPVPPAQAAALAERLRAEPGTLWPAGLPLPQAIPTRRLTQPYQPVLRLLEQGIPVQQPGRRTTQTQRFGLARLDHEYGGRLLTGRGHEWYAAGELIVESPDPAAEQAATQQITRLGLKRVTKLLPRGAQTNLPEARRLYGFSDPERWQTFLEQDVPRLEAAGFQIELEPSFPHHYAQIQDWYGETETDGGWFTLELGVVIDGERYSLLPVIAALAEQKPELFTPGALAELTPTDTFTVRLEDGRRVQLPAERVRDILGVLGELHLGLDDTDTLRLPLLDAARLAQLAERVPAHWDGAAELLELGERLESFAGLSEIQPPQGLQAELRGYQREGVAWLQFLREYGLGGILADDMGLGKTLQTLTHLLTEKEAGRADLPSLVVAPTSVLGGWRAEAERFAPDLRVLVLHGPGREQHFGSLGDYDLILTSYSLLPRDLEVLKRQPLHYVVLDEAQNIKNHRSQAAQAAGQLRTRHRLALTGTPLENHLGELWSLFNFVSPGLLGTAGQFREQFRGPIEKRGDPARQQALNARVRPFILRREKQVVAKELPPKTEIPVFLTLTPAQRDLYETVREGVLGRVQAELERRAWAERRSPFWTHYSNCGRSPLTPACCALRPLRASRRAPSATGSKNSCRNWWKKAAAS